MKNRLRITSLLLVGLSVISNANASDQDSLNEVRLIDFTLVSQRDDMQSWLAFGFGGGRILEAAIVSVTASYNIQFSHNLLTARLISGVSYDNNQSPVFEAGLLYGYGVNNSLWYANVSVGLAYISITRRVFVREEPGPIKPVNIYRVEEYNKNIGIPWQGQVFSKFSDSSSVGMGIMLCGNVNKAGSLFSTFFTLEFIF